LIRRKGKGEAERPRPVEVRLELFASLGFRHAGLVVALDAAVVALDAEQGTGLLLRLDSRNRRESEEGHDESKDSSGILTHDSYLLSVKPFF
jgi:hypothetical protein